MTPSAPFTRDDVAFLRALATGFETTIGTAHAAEVVELRELADRIDATARRADGAVTADQLALAAWLVACDDGAMFISRDTSETTITLDTVGPRIAFAWNCSDIFGWACADLEEVPWALVPAVADIYRADGVPGVLRWIIARRGTEPQAPARYLAYPDEAETCAVCGREHQRGYPCHGYHPPVTPAKKKWWPWKADRA